MVKGFGCRPVRDRLAGLEQRVWECQCALVRLDGSLAALAQRLDDLAP